MARATRNDPQVNIKMPQKLKDELDEIARVNNRSRNSEIIFLVEQAVKTEKARRASNTIGFETVTTTTN